MTVSYSTVLMAHNLITLQWWMLSIFVVFSEDPCTRILGIIFPEVILLSQRVQTFWRILISIAKLLPRRVHEFMVPPVAYLGKDNCYRLGKIEHFHLWSADFLLMRLNFFISLFVTCSSFVILHASSPNLLPYNPDPHTLWIFLFFLRY